MALSASTVLEVRQNGSDTNGGGYVTGGGGTDWSQQATAQYAVTDGVTAGTTTLTSATAAWGTDVVGNLAYVAGGTGSVTAGWYQVISRTNATTIVVDRSTGLTAGTGVTINIGGALATPGNAATIATVNDQKIYIKYSATPYNLTTATPGASGPVVFTASIRLTIEGYDVVRGDRTGNRPRISWASVASPGSNTYLFALQSRQVVANIIADGNSVVNVSGFNTTLVTGNRSTLIDCITRNANTGFITGGCNMIKCQADTCTTGYSGSGMCYDSDAVNCTTGYSNFLSAVKCLARLCGTGFASNNAPVHMERCIADSCTNIGIDFSTSIGASAISCLATNQSGGGGIGIKVIGGSVLINCAFYNNTTHISGTPQLNEGQITLTQQPYTVAGSDFRPNNVAGGGTSLRNAGIGVFGQTDTVDVGAVQSTNVVQTIINQVINAFRGRRGT